MRFSGNSSPLRLAFTAIFCSLLIQPTQTASGQDAEILAAFPSLRDLTVISLEGDFVRTIPYDFEEPFYSLEYAAGKTHLFPLDATRYVVEPNGAVTTLTLDGIDTNNGRGSVTSDGRYVTSTIDGNRSELYVHGPDGSLQWSRELTHPDFFYRQADSDSDGNIFVAYGDQIHKYDTEGNLLVTEFTDEPGFNIAVDDESNQLFLGYTFGGIAIFDISREIEFKSSFDTIATNVSAVSDIEYHAPTESIYYSNLRDIFEVTVDGEHLREISIAENGELMPIFTLVPTTVPEPAGTIWFILSIFAAQCLRRKGL